MTVEVTDHIDGLVPTNPVEADLVAEGNEVFHLLKIVLRNIFPDNTLPGQFDFDLVLAPAGTTPATGAGTRDIYAKAIDVAEDITIAGGIFGAAEVAIAAAKIDGTTGEPIATQFGIVSTVRLAPGDYQITLIETASGFDDLVVGGNVNFALAGGGYFATVPVSVGVFRLLTFHPSSNSPLDCATVELTVFDRGRDVP